MRICKICKHSFDDNDVISGHGIRHQIESLIKLDFPDWTDYDFICNSDFALYRVKYTKIIISKETSDLDRLENDLIKSIHENDLITENTNLDFEGDLKIGDKISDKVASFGGSWSFIILFFAILLFWIILNTIFLLRKPFDAYPFIFLNLILSCIAAIQAPVIMMSQNRQEKKDRIRAENDYKVNIKSEIEIRTLHEKVDHLLLVQWSRLIEIQDLQIEILEDIKKSLSKNNQ